MAETFRKNSASAAEQKTKWVGIAVAAVLYLLVFLMNFVFDTQLREEMRDSLVSSNIIGIILYLFSFGTILIGSNAIPTKYSGAGFTITALILLALGICASCGFWYGSY